MVVFPHIFVATLLASSAVGVDRALRRRETELGRKGLLLLVCACSVAMTVGMEPGLVFHSWREVALVLVCFAVAFTVVRFRRPDMLSAFVVPWCVVYFAAAGAAWQLGAAPMLAVILVRP